MAALPEPQTAAASARGGSVNISGGLLDGDFGNNIYGGYAQSSNGNAVAEANSVVLDGTASLNVEKYISRGIRAGKRQARQAGLRPGTTR